MNNAAAHNQKKMSWQLLAILAVSIIPIVAAYIAYYTGWGVPQDTVNEGVLLQPTKNVADLLTEAEGDKPQFADNLQWRLLIPVPADCDKGCQQNLYITRQVHIRLAEKGDRVERYAVNLGGAAGEDFLRSIQAEHPGLKHFSVPPKTWERWLAGSNVPNNFTGDHYYLLVDQVGFAMMYYSLQHDGNQLLKDLKRVLRHSPGG